jgi:hypothetical protein
MAMIPRLTKTVVKGLCKFNNTAMETGSLRNVQQRV